jgi:RHS repeat-associated protein
MIICKKVTQVKDNSTNPPKIISFDYDAHGNRVKKTVDLGSTNCADNSVTYYVYSEKGTVVATYKRKGCFETAMPIILSDHTIQSNQRMGLRTYPQTGTIVPLDNVAHYNTQGYSSREIFRKHYELSDHLGNVRAVISDAKWSYNGIMTPHIVSYTNYYPFGMAQPGRNWSSGGYRFGYNGVEKDDEIKGSGNSYNFEFRMHDPRVGRFLSLDPLMAKNTGNSPYLFAGNSPIWAIDYLGLDDVIFVHGTDQDPKSENYAHPAFIATISAIADKFHPNHKGVMDFSFDWSETDNIFALNWRFNTELARSAAADLLVAYILKTHKKGDAIILMGYSHGGNVILNALPKLKEALIAQGEASTTVEVDLLQTPSYSFEDDDENVINAQEYATKINVFYAKGIKDKTIGYSGWFSGSNVDYQHEYKEGIWSGIGRNGKVIKTDKITPYLLNLSDKNVKYELNDAHAWLYDYKTAATLLGLPVKTNNDVWNEGIDRKKTKGLKK